VLLEYVGQLLSSLIEALIAFHLYLESTSAETGRTNVLRELRPTRPWSRPRTEILKVRLS
jgi:hypothetical protein